MMSFLIIAGIYILASILGIWAYDRLPGPVWLKLLEADGFATVIVFLFSLLFRNASVYDPYWSVQPPVILGVCALRYPLNGFTVLLFGTVCIWALRLTGNWAYTFHGLDHEDWRYRMLREKTGTFYPFVNLFGIHLVPTCIVYMCTLPAFYAITENYPGGFLSVLFCLLSLFAVALQGTADMQMHRFRSKGTGGLIREGLWKLSRHPNYLGEILMWWGVALAVFCAVPRLLFLLGALLNTAMFLFISIPMAEKRQSVKPGWEEYRRETPALLIWK